MTADSAGAGLPRQFAPALAHEHPPTVAIVDLDRRVRAALADALRVAGLDVVGTGGGAAEALELIERGAHVLVVDPRLPEVTDGLALVERLAADRPDVHVVFIGWAENADARLASRGSAYIAKSATPEEFVAATKAACGY